MTVSPTTVWTLYAGVSALGFLWAWWAYRCGWRRGQAEGYAQCHSDMVPWVDPNAYLDSADADGELPVGDERPTARPVRLNFGSVK